MKNSKDKDDDTRTREAILVAEDLAERDRSGDARKTLRMPAVTDRLAWQEKLLRRPRLARYASLVEASTEMDLAYAMWVEGASLFGAVA